jgi:Response regulator containing a CheY-like receiver domain and an HTH DNA-binding domain
MAAFPPHPLYIGLGFALGFGWLWFPALQALWLPVVVWGSPLYGGGGLTLALLFAGFAACGLSGRHTAAFKAGLSHLHPVHGPHGASLALVALSVLPTWPETGLAPYIPVFFMAGLGLCQGLYWVGALLALPARQAAAAFFVAALAQAGLALGQLTIPEDWNRVFMVLSVAAAWWVARQFALLPPHRVEEARRPRGRPVKARVPVSAGQGQPLSLAVPGITFALLVAAEAVVPPSFSVSHSQIALLTASGAAAGFLLCFLPVPQGLLGLPLALAGLVVVFFPEAQWRWMAPPFAEGLFLPLALLLLCRRQSACAPAQYAARCLGTVLVLSFVADILPEIFVALRLSRSAGLFIGVSALLLAMVPFFSFSSDLGLLMAGAVPEWREQEAGLTPRELEILQCLNAGMNDGTIAAHLSIKETTVRFHLANLFRKTGHDTRAKLAAMGLKKPPRPKGKTGSQLTEQSTGT